MRDKKELSIRKGAVVPRTNAMCESDHDARMLLARVLEAGDSMECVPLESASGECLHFATPCDGHGYTLRYRTESVGESEHFLRIVDATVERNEAYDMDPKEYPQYRVTFHYSAEARMEALEFAWLLGKHDIDVLAKSDASPMIFVRAKSRAALQEWADDINLAFGPLIFEKIEGSGPQGYEEIDFQEVWNV